MLDKMFDKKKLNFWRLAFLFAGLVITILFLLWSSPQENQAQMMNGSMGNMMKQMHVSNITISGLLGKGGQEAQVGEIMSEMHSHHQGQTPIIYRLNYLSTAVVFLLLPLIVGGSIVLAIVWIK